MATRVWTGLGADNNWSTPQNWDMGGSSIPSLTDAVIFDSRGTKDCTIDSVGTWSGGSLSINSGYTGTITAQCPLTMGAFSHAAAATFALTTYSCFVTSLSVTNASSVFTSTAGTLTVSVGSFTFSAGTFNANGGIVQFVGIGSPTINAPGVTFNLVQLSGTSDVSVSASTTLPLGTDPYIAANITGSGTINATGTISTIGNFSPSALTGSVTAINLLGPGGTHTFSASFPGGLDINITSLSTNVSLTLSASVTWGDIRVIGAASGTGTVSVLSAGNPTFTSFRDNDGLAAHTLKFSSSKTFTAASWLLSGSSGKQLTIGASSAGSAAILSSSGSDFTSSYLTISDSRVDSSPRWNADTTCIRGSNVNNWVFNPAMAYNAPPVRQGPPAQRVKSPPLPYGDVAPTVDRYFAFPARNPYVWGMNTGPMVLRRAAWKPDLTGNPDQTPAWTFTRRQFVMPNYPIPNMLRMTGPVVHWMERNFPISGDLASVTNTRFVMPTYPDHAAMRVGPMPLRAGIWPVPFNTTRAPETNERFVFPTYGRKARVVPPAIRAARAQSIALVAVAPAPTTRPYYFAKKRRN